jgi:predicted RNA-binding protein with PIN domain
MPYWFDGNNLIGQSAASVRTDAQTRQAFLSELSGYHMAGGSRFLVYFDGDDSDRRMPPRGVSVRYSAPLSTDEAILTALRDSRHPSEVIVVTNDLGLAMRCREAGSKVIDWNEFSSKMKRRTHSMKKPGDKSGRLMWRIGFGISVWIKTTLISEKQIAVPQSPPYKTADCVPRRITDCGSFRNAARRRNLSL